jgi:arylsulfatase A
MKNYPTVLMTLLAGAAGAEPSDARPNILFILADDMGVGDVGAFSFGASKTPAIDSLLHDGTALMQHYAGSAVCTPSRACLMTGRYPQRTGAIDTQHELNELSLRERTVAQVLRDGGYATGIVGKWHLGWDDPQYRPQARGFQEATALEKTDHWNWVIDRNGKREESDGRYLSDVLSDEAVGFVQRHQSEPFFLYLAYFTPHAPFTAPEEDIQPFRDAGLSETLSAVYGMIHRMDRGIGRVLDELKRLGLDRNTLVVFTSDNGPQFATSWTNRTGAARYNLGFRGHKDLVYEGGIRVPCAVRWPAGLPPLGRVYTETHFSDWFPTLLAAAGVPIPNGLKLDGQNMLPLLRGTSGYEKPPRFWQFSRYWPNGTHNAAVRDGDWKLVRPIDQTDDGVTGPVLGVLPPAGLAAPTCDRLPGERYIPRLPVPLPSQLFNLREDPQEQHDVSAQYPERVQRMETMMNQWFESVMQDLNQTERK